MKKVIADLTEELKVKERIEGVFMTVDDKTGQYAIEIKFPPKKIPIHKVFLIMLMRGCMKCTLKMRWANRDKELADFLNMMIIKEWKSE